LIHRKDYLSHLKNILHNEIERMIYQSGDTTLNAATKIDYQNEYDQKNRKKFQMKHGISLSFPPTDYETLPQRQYVTSKNNNFVNRNKNVHWGQLKLLLSEIHFLTEELNSLEDKVLCVYAGAAPGENTQAKSHLLELIKHFPNTKWLLCDPRFTRDNDNEFQELIGAKKVQIYKDIFNKETATQIVNFPRDKNNIQQCLNNLELDKFDTDWKNKILFISDIRVDHLQENEVEKDMRLQESCFKLLNARAGLFKFRPPYPEDEKSSETYKYLNGEIFWPVYGPVQTTECRLYAKKDARTFEYNCKIHQDVLYAFNCYQRPEFDEKAQKKIVENYQTKFKKQWEGIAAKIPTRGMKRRR